LHDLLELIGNLKAGARRNEAKMNQVLPFLKFAISIRFRKDEQIFFNLFRKKYFNSEGCF